VLKILYVHVGCPGLSVIISVQFTVKHRKTLKRKGLQTMPRHCHVFKSAIEKIKHPFLSYLDFKAV